MAAAPAGASVMSIASPQALALTGLRNPGSYQLFTGGFDAYLKHTWSGGLQGYADWVRRTHPDLIAAYGGEKVPWLGSVLAAYVRLGGAPGWFWYARADLSPERLAAIRASLAEVRAARLA
jgi:hypothetical protein